jgi:hypothetical protein
MIVLIIILVAVLSASFLFMLTLKELFKMDEQNLKDHGYQEERHDKEK